MYPPTLNKYTMNIQELPLEFEGGSVDVQGYKFTQVKKSDKAYIYKKDGGTGQVFYEVFRRKEVHKFDFKSKTQLEDKKVTYPKSRSFGDWAWDFMDYDTAVEKFNQLNSDDEKPKKTPSIEGVY